VGAAEVEDDEGDTWRHSTHEHSEKDIKVSDDVAIIEKAAGKNRRILRHHSAHDHHDLGNDANKKTSYDALATEHTVYEVDDKSNALWVSDGFNQLTAKMPAPPEIIVWALKKCTGMIPSPEFGRMVNLGIIVFYIYLLGQSWTLWDCIELEDGTYVMQSDPAIKCFWGDIEIPTFRGFEDDTEPVIEGRTPLYNTVIMPNGDWPFYAPPALILAMLCTYMPYKLYINLRYELNDSHHTKLEHEKNMGFLYMKYKPEYWYWEPVVEMSRKWFVVFFSTFMPTGQSQAALDIVITLVYWYLHYMHEPYRTDWKDAEGNPADPDLENNLQHYMYAIQIVMVVAMMSYESYEDNPDAGGAVLLAIYFIGVAVLVYGIAKTMQRQRNRSKMLATEDTEEEAQGKKSSSVEMVKKVFDGMGGA